MGELTAAFEWRKCIVSAQEYDTGEIILDEGLDKVRDVNNTVLTEWGVSPEVSLELERGFVALIAIDSNKSIKNKQGVITPDTAFRIGKIIFLSDAAFIDTFKSNPPPGKYAFVDDKYLIKLFDS